MNTKMTSDKTPGYAYCCGCVLMSFTGAVIFAFMTGSAALVIARLGPDKYSSHFLSVEYLPFTLGICLLLGLITGIVADYPKQIKRFVRWWYTGES